MQENKNVTVNVNLNDGNKLTFPNVRAFEPTPHWVSVVDNDGSLVLIPWEHVQYVKAVQGKIALVRGN